jgi:hypothetical protein
VELKEETDELVKVGAFDHHYPATRIQWAPKARTGTHDLLATTGDYLRLWNVKDRSEVCVGREGDRCVECTPTVSRFTCAYVYVCVFCVGGFVERQ